MTIVLGIHRFHCDIELGERRVPEQVRSRVIGMEVERMGWCDRQRTQRGFNRGLLVSEPCNT